MYAGPGAKFLDATVAYGLQSRRANPKRKKRLPYHGNRLLNLPIMAQKELPVCMHSLARFEVVSRDVTASYAIACQVKHRPTTKSPVHKDTLKRSWK